MKKSFLICIICFSAFSLKAQEGIYGEFRSRIYDQQKDILKKEKVKKITASFGKKKTSAEFIFFDSIGNIQKTIEEDYSSKMTHTYAYDKLNNLVSIMKITKEGKFKKYAHHVHVIVYDSEIPFPGNKLYYNYDDKNRLIEKKVYKDDYVCKIEQIKYFGNKVYTYYQDVHGEIEKIKVIERNDSIERKLELDEINKIVQKSIIFYNKDSLKLKEERFKNDTLIYSVENKIENNKIIQTIKRRYFKNQKTHKMNQSVDSVYFEYKSNHSIKTIKSVSTNAINDEPNFTKYKYIYNKKGLLIKKQEYSDDKQLHFTILYEYEMW